MLPRIDLVSLSLRHENQVPEHRLTYLYALSVQTSLRRSQLIDPPEINDPHVVLVMSNVMKKLGAANLLRPWSRLFSRD